MGERKRILTILHASDLHIGEIDPLTGNASYSPALTALLSNLTWFDGVLGHHGRGLEHLAAFLQQLRGAGENPLVLVSGDLTRVGGIRSSIRLSITSFHKSIFILRLAITSAFSAMTGNTEPSPGIMIGGREHPPFLADLGPPLVRIFRRQTFLMSVPISLCPMVASCSSLALTRTAMCLRAA